MLWPERGADRAPRAFPARAHIERDGLRYEFDGLTGAEKLLELAPSGRAGRDVLAERPADAARLRRTLADQLGLEDLADLVDHNRDAAEALRRLGYL